MNLINSTEIIWRTLIGQYFFCYTVKPGTNITRILSIHFDNS
jgi:hypothetical protein